MEQVGIDQGAKFQTGVSSNIFHESGVK